MKLQELAVPNTSKNFARVFESYFGNDITVAKLDQRQASTMLLKVRGVIKEHQKTSQRHFNERNPHYLKLMMMEQALAKRLMEFGAPPVPGAANTGTKPQPTGSTNTVDPKLKAAQDKLKRGQQLTPDEQKLINDTAAAVTETRLRRAYRMLKESEVQQAQVVLAAQDMVDKMQGMLEDVSELQFKELPALVDSIKNQVGIDQATQFNQDATAALTGLLQNIQGAKQQLDAALGVVTGQTPAGGDAMANLAAAGDDQAAVGGDLEAAGMDTADDLAGADLEAGADLDAEEPAPALGSKGALGRERR